MSRGIEKNFMYIFKKLLRCSCLVGRKILNTFDLSEKQPMPTSRFTLQFESILAIQSKSASFSLTQVLSTLLGLPIQPIDPNNISQVLTLSSRSIFVLTEEQVSQYLHQFWDNGFRGVMIIITLNSSEHFKAKYKIFKSVPPCNYKFFQPPWSLLDILNQVITLRHLSEEVSRILLNQLQLSLMPLLQELENNVRPHLNNLKKNGYNLNELTFLEKKFKHLLSKDDFARHQYLQLSDGNNQQIQIIFRDTIQEIKTTAKITPEQITLLDSILIRWQEIISTTP